MRGKLITLEGIEGVGKSTVHTFVVDALKSALQSDVLRTREPGGTPLAEKIRGLALGIQAETVHPDTELLLMFAARAQHLHEVIWPALNAGRWVVSDRFVDASYAYQGAGRGIPVAKLDSLTSCIMGDFKPDLVIVLDAPVEVAMRRAKSRNTIDRFEEETVSFFERVRQCYLERAAADPSHYAVVNAALSLESVELQLATILESLCASSHC